jgi:hypothetical protein
MILKVLRNVHLLDLHIKQYISSSKTLYLILSKNDQTCWYKLAISSVEVYDQHVIFHIIPYISPRSYIIP